MRAESEPEQGKLLWGLARRKRHRIRRKMS
jgi:hypothetical protein